MADTYPEIFDGYRIVRPAIGRGGAGVVHEALTPDGQRVAIKVLDRQTIEARLLKRFEEQHASRGSDSIEPAEETRRAYEKYVEHFKEEYQTLVSLAHPNIARVRHIGFYEGHFYIVSEFVDGKPIAEHVRGWKPLDMIPLFIQALSGLDFIHRSGLIHLDIKSQNILVHATDSGPQVKIIDFGLAMQPADYSGGFMGTLSTMAPEVALGFKEQVDARADLFSFGVVMYQCITWGRLPFGRLARDDRMEMRRDIEYEAHQNLRLPSRAHRKDSDLVPEFLDTIVIRLLAHKPQDRFYGNARAVINALTTHMPDVFRDDPDTRGAYLRPERGRLIGRDEELETVEKGIQTLVEGNQPSISIFSITGEGGMGKTLFLKHLKDAADKYVETVSVHSLVFPANEDVIEEKTANLSRQLAENAKPVIVFIDDLHELSSNSKAVGVISGLIRLVVERRHKPDVYAGIQPAMLVFTTTAQPSGFLSWLASILASNPEALQTIVLKPFSAKDIETYLLSTPALHGRELPKERVDALYR
ncbi:MAG: protein kinase, partial [Pseudomonadota bacterium]